MSASERGHRRLVEQGALAHTELGRGPLPAVRAAERAVSAQRLATERLRWERKLRALWQSETFTDGPAALEQTRARIDGAGLLRLLEPSPADVHVAAAELGLTGPLPDTYDVLTGLESPAALVMRLDAVVGRALIGTDPHTGRTLVADTRLLAGYRLGACDDRSRSLHLDPRTRSAGEHHRDQTRLF